MLLNAANVVTAAERCKAIDEKTGRIPINFLLSRSTDLDEHVKDQLQQLAVTSPSISIFPDPSRPSLSRQHNHDAVMTDVPQPTQQQQRQQQTDVSMRSGEDDEDEDDDDDGDDDDGDHDHDNVSQPSRRFHTSYHHHHQYPYHQAETHPSFDRHHLSHPDHQRTTSSLALEHLGTEAEEEALKDIDRETNRPDRGGLMRRTQKRNQTLTRKAIRKHTGTKKLNISTHKGSAMDSSSTRNTTVSSGVQSSVASSASQHSNTPRRRWKEWEDQLLMQVVAEHGPTRWNNLARHFPGRNGRQVRLRWMNHLQPSLDKRPWRPEEDAVLLEAHKALGNKWALISMRLGGRTDNSVKNRYKSIARRAAREAKAARKQE